MKRSRKSTFFIVAILIAALAFTAFAGVYTYNGDYKNAVVKGAGDIRWGIDIRGGVEAVFTPSDDVDTKKITETQLKAAVSVIEKRMMAINITDYEVYPDNDSKEIIIRFPWNSDDESFDPESAIKEIGTTAQLKFCYGSDKNDVILTGEDVESAEGTLTQSNDGKYENVVSFKLNSSGKKAFAEATQKQLSSGGTISIWLDDDMISNPKVSAAITEGSGIISGNFTQNSANTLAMQINSGALPFSLQIEENRTQVITPTLGENALQAMLIAGTIAFAAVCIIMLLNYRLMGFVACISLVGHLALTIAAISGYFPVFNSFTMTIPGLAGIILSIGMGVDANVISFERVKDELRFGKTIDGSIAAGYKNSFSAILDGNVTVIIVALILMGSFGPADGFLAKILSKVILFMFKSTLSGSIYSFGYTLLIGVICNFVMGIWASKTMLKSISRFEVFRNEFFFPTKPAFYEKDGKLDIPAEADQEEGGEQE